MNATMLGVFVGGGLVLALGGVEGLAAIGFPVALVMAILFGSADKF